MRSILSPKVTGDLLWVIQCNNLCKAEPIICDSKSCAVRHVNLFFWLCDLRKIWSLVQGRQCPLPLASLHMAASSMEPQHGISKSAKSLIFPLFIEISCPLMAFQNVALGSCVLVLMTTLSWDSEVCFDHPWGIISASECENTFRHFAKQRDPAVHTVHWFTGVGTSFENPSLTTRWWH